MRKTDSDKIATNPKRLLTDRERTRLLLDATPTQLEKIDAVLLGKVLTPAKTAPLSKKTYSVTKAADELGMSRKSVYKLVRENLLKATPFGNHFRISEQALQDYLIHRQTKERKTRYL